MAIIYLAGGCFWGVEKLMRSIPGVTDAVSGYANGRIDRAPTYEEVCGGQTGCRETVRVEYDPAAVSLEALLFAYFSVIDPTLKHRQGNDVGEQYQAGIYYVDSASKRIVERIAQIERAAVSPFAVEIAPLDAFYDAEAYHQRYLEKHPMGYCHIAPKEFKAIISALAGPIDYDRPAKVLLAEKHNL